jgi:hypothetical protein
LVPPLLHCEKTFSFFSNTPGFPPRLNRVPPRPPPPAPRPAATSATTSAALHTPIRRLGCPLKSPCLLLLPPARGVRVVLKIVKERRKRRHAAKCFNEILKTSLHLKPKVPPLISPSSQTFSAGAALARETRSPCSRDRVPHPSARTALGCVTFRTSILRGVSVTSCQMFFFHAPSMFFGFLLITSFGPSKHTHATITGSPVRPRRGRRAAGRRQRQGPPRG